VAFGRRGIVRAISTGALLGIVRAILVALLGITRARAADVQLAHSDWPLLIARLSRPSARLELACTRQQITVRPRPTDIIFLLDSPLS
jgi:hypothetical protein